MNKIDVEDVELITVAETGSTNSDLLSDPKYSGRGPLALRAVRQNAGRGRQGRPWVSEEGGLFFSLRWSFSRSPQELSGLALLVSLSLIKTLDTLGYPDIAIKWPNDLYYQGKKLAGILIELGTRTSVTPAVIGVGLNLYPPSMALDQAVSALSEIKVPMSAEHLFPALVRGLSADLQHFEAEGFQAFKSDWERHALWINQTVQCGSLSGQFLGVNDQGAARILTAEGEHLLLSGDVSLREGAA